MTAETIKVGIIAGEVSGDLLGGDLIAALRAAHDGRIELVGVGGEALERQGLKSLFDFSELSIMGISQVLKRLPSLLRRIRHHIVHKPLDRISPLAVPILLDIGKTPIFGEARESVMADAADELMREAMGQAPASTRRTAVPPPPKRSGRNNELRQRGGRRRVAK